MNPQPPVLRRGIAVTSTGPDDTVDLAAIILGAFPACRLFALHGDLGTGKTCFVRGLALALGVREFITSPTYTIVREYAGTPPLIHADLYRIQSPDELVAIGLEDYFDSPAVVVLEWAERAGDLLPADALHLTFTLAGEDQRRIELT